MRKQRRWSASHFVFAPCELFLMPVMMFDMIYFSMLNCCLPITKVKTNKLRGGKIIMNSVEDENRCEWHSGLPVCTKNAIAII